MGSIIAPSLMSQGGVSVTPPPLGNRDIESPWEIGLKTYIQSKKKFDFSTTPEQIFLKFLTKSTKISASNHTTLQYNPFIRALNVNVHCLCMYVFKDFNVFSVRHKFVLCPSQMKYESVANFVNLYIKMSQTK